MRGIVTTGAPRRFPPVCHTCCGCVQCECRVRCGEGGRSPPAISILGATTHFCMALRYYTLLYGNTLLEARHYRRVCMPHMVRCFCHSTFPTAYRKMSFFSYERGQQTNARFCRSTSQGINLSLCRVAKAAAASCCLHASAIPALVGNSCCCCLHSCCCCLHTSALPSVFYERCSTLHSSTKKKCAKWILWAK